MTDQTQQDEHNSPVDDFIDDSPAAPAVEKPTDEQKPKANVEFKVNPLSPHKDGSKDRTSMTLRIPSDHPEETSETLGKLPNLDYSNDPIARRWGATLDASAVIQPRDSVFRDALGRENSVWRQGPEHPSGDLVGSYPRFRPAGNTELVGVSAISRLRAYRGLGSMYRVPLWNSGFWITITAPSEPEILELHNLISQDKATLGRRSYGMSFSNMTAIYADRIVAFALEHIYNTSLTTKPDSDLRDFIKCTDIPTIAMAVAASMYPNGFNYERACLADPENCKHVISEKIDISKTLLVDTNSLSASQIKHMSKLTHNSMTEEEVLRYQEEMVIAQRRKYTMDAKGDAPITVYMRVPNIKQYIEAGHRWINEISALVDRAMTKEVSNDQRNTYLIKHGQATTMRMYAHWVDSFEFGGSEVKDTETIEESLNTISADDVLRNEFSEYVQNYIASSNISVIGVPSFECPNCGGVNASDKPHPEIRDAIPIDLYQTFFEVIALRVRTISER